MMMMRNPIDWYVVLVTPCIVLPYLLRVRPYRQKDWTALAFTIGFLTWLLVGFGSLRIDVIWVTRARTCSNPPAARLPCC